MRSLNTRCGMQPRSAQCAIQQTLDRRSKSFRNGCSTLAYPASITCIYSVPFFVTRALCSDHFFWERSRLLVVQRLRPDHQPIVCVRNTSPESRRSHSRPGTDFGAIWGSRGADDFIRRHYCIGVVWDVDFECGPSLELLPLQHGLHRYLESAPLVCFRFRLDEAFVSVACGTWKSETCVIRCCPYRRE